MLFRSASSMVPSPHPPAPQPEAYDLLADFPALQPQGKVSRLGSILPKALHSSSLDEAAPEVSYSALFKAVEDERLVGVEENSVTPCPGGYWGVRRKQGSRIGDQKGSGIARVSSTLTTGCAKSRPANIEEKRGKATPTTAGTSRSAISLSVSLPLSPPLSFLSISSSLPLLFLGLYHSFLSLL